MSGPHYSTGLDTSWNYNNNYSFGSAYPFQNENATVSAYSGKAYSPKTGTSSGSSSALKGIGAGLSGLSTLLQLDAITKQADYQASVAEANASLAKEQEGVVGQQGAWQANQIRSQGQQLIGTQRAAAAANGLDVQTGSPLDITTSTAGKVEQNAQTALYNANLKMWGLQNQANAYEAQAQNILQAAKYQKTATILNGISNIALAFA